MTHVLSQSNFKQREKPPEAHKTGMGEENCTHKEPQPGAVGQPTGNSLSIQLAKVTAADSASPTSVLKLIKSYAQSSNLSAGWNTSLGQVGLLGNSKADDEEF